MTDPLPVETHLKLAIAVLLCILAVAVGGDPSVGSGRAVGAFLIAFGYAIVVLVRAVAPPGPRRRART